MLKSFKSFKSFKGDSNVSFQILCKSTAILLYRCEENIKKLLNRIFVASILCQLIPNLIRVLLQKVLLLIFYSHVPTQILSG